MSQLECPPLWELERQMARQTLGILRGADFSVSIGGSSWRVGLYMPLNGFETWIFGKGDSNTVCRTDATLVSVTQGKVPYIGTLKMLLLYTLHAVRLRFDVIVCTPYLGIVAAIARAIGRETKLVLDVRSIPVESRSTSGMLHEAWFRCALRHQHYDGFTTISHGMLDELDEVYRVKERFPTAVWGSGFDGDLFQPQPRESPSRRHLGRARQLHLLYHGSLSPTRGLDQAIRSFHILQTRGVDDVHLTLIGQGQARPALTRLASELAINDRVSILPPVPHDQIPGLIAEVDVGIDPLPDHPWWRHQSAMKVFEFLAMGKPVIATDIPCHQDISPAVLLVPDNSPETLADAILYYRGLAPAARAELRDAALHDSQQYTWQARACTLAEFLKQEVIGQTGA